MALRKLQKNKEDVFVCPQCGRSLHFVDGGAVQLVDGRPDMENIRPKYECEPCGVFYREFMDTGYYDVFPLHEEPKPRRIKAVGELMPVRLQKDAEGKCTCPRCGEQMYFVEGQAVQLVDGRPDMENVWGHFHCDFCRSNFRRIARTDFFQWSEK